MFNRKSQGTISMSHALLGGPSHHSQRQRMGQSDEYQKSYNAEGYATSHATEPISQGGWKRDLMDKAIDIYRNCSKEGWDCYDASPVTLQALREVLLLIEKLPPEAPKPFIVPTPEGEISMEWFTKGKQVLSVYPKEEYLIYAASLGPMNNQFGHFPLTEGWPDQLLLMLENYFVDANVRKS